MAIIEDLDELCGEEKKDKHKRIDYMYFIKNHSNLHFHIENIV